MGKSKKPRIPNYNHHDNPANPKNRRAGSGPSKGKLSKGKPSRVNVSGGKGSGAGNANGSGNGKMQQSLSYFGYGSEKVPFGKGDRILLVGEGMFLFFFFLLSLYTYLVHWFGTLC